MKDQIEGDNRMGKQEVLQSTLKQIKKAYGDEAQMRRPGLSKKTPVQDQFQKSGFAVLVSF